MERDAAPTGMTIAETFPSQHNTFRFHATGRGWSSRGGRRGGGAAAAAALPLPQQKAGTNVKPRHVHTYDLRAVKKEVQKLTTTRSM